MRAHDSTPLRVIVGRHIDGMNSSLLHDGQERRLNQKAELVTLSITEWSHACYYVCAPEPNMPNRLYVLEPADHTPAHAGVDPLVVTGEFRVVKRLEGEEANEAWTNCFAFGSIREDWHARPDELARTPD